VTELLAVYGTLMTGLALPQQPPGVERSLRLRGACRIPGRLHDMGVGYPALVVGEGSVAGELYEVADLAVLEVLDAYEPPPYTRRQVRLVEPEVDAWTYVYEGEPPPDSLIDEADWRAFVAVRGAR
jgi:gamma-glutamylcyclotransferase (GGCT)/AIG2-like uncharacterized protein YtfP